MQENRRRYARDEVIRCNVSISNASWQFLKEKAMSASPNHRMSVTRYVNSHIDEYQYLTIPDYMVDIKQQRGGYWTVIDFQAGDPRPRRTLWITDHVIEYCQALCITFQIPSITSLHESRVGIALELIGRGWISDRPAA